MRIGPALRLFATVGVGATAVASAQLSTVAVEDATIYEAPSDGIAGCFGANSNGAGQHIFSGVTDAGSSFSERRALLRFDVSLIPPGATIQSATVTLNLNRSARFGPLSESFGLHRLNASWGEGTTDAGGREGDGDPASPGDATWCERFFGATLWTTPGGEFVAQPSAVTSVGSVSSPPVPAPYTWGSNPAMVADVQAWVDIPSSNHGWILVDQGNGSGPANADGLQPTARRFNSSESPTVGLRPQLVVLFGLPPSGVPAASGWGLALLAGLLAAAGLGAMRRLR